MSNLIKNVVEEVRKMLEAQRRAHEIQRFALAELQIRLNRIAALLDIAPYTGGSRNESGSDHTAAY